MTYEAELVNKQFDQNIIIKIGSKYWGGREPDSGLTLDANKTGAIRSASIQPNSVDIIDATSTVQVSSFELMDINEDLTFEISDSDSQLTGDDVTIYIGRITGSFAFSDYKTVSISKIKGFRKTTSGYHFSCYDSSNKFNKELFKQKTNLNGSITNVATTITVNDTSSFPAPDSSTTYIKIDDEFMLVTGKTATTFTVTRAQLNSVGVAHDDNIEVQNVIKLEENPIVSILKLISSTSGDGSAYDTLSDGLGVDTGAYIDVSSFTTINTNNFSTDTFRTYLYDIDDGLKYLQEHFLLPLGCRFINIEGKIGLGLLDRVDFTASVTTIDEDSIIGTPEYEVDVNRVVNRVVVSYDYSDYNDSYNAVYENSDSESIARFGQTTIFYGFKNIRPDLSGSTFIASFASRLLARVSIPRTRLSVRTHMDVSNEDIANDVRISHRHLPGTGSGALGLDTYVEVMEKSFDLNSATATYVLEFTSYSNLRFGLIAPAATINSATGTSLTFTGVDLTDVYKTNYAVALWEIGVGYDVGGVTTITSSTYSGGDTTVVLSSLNGATVGSNTHILKFGDYDESTSLQKSRFAYVCPNSGTFSSDGAKAYQVIY